LVQEQKVTPFTFLDAICYSKADMYNEDTAKEYIPFIINKGLSNFGDVILYANEVNIWHDMPKRHQFQYLKHSIPKKKRFSRWPKKSKDADAESIAKVYQCNPRRAAELLSVLTSPQLKEIRSLAKMI
jgi:hypothetical protein